VTPFLFGFATSMSLIVAIGAQNAFVLRQGIRNEHVLPEVLLTGLALTFLNPHVYLDTVVLLGTLANQRSDGRWLFGVGATVASTVWFVSLGFGARRLAGLFASPGTWRLLDGLIAVIMVALGISLALTPF
jgi:L-lysine exporter family protein LysE/ArgO